MRKPPPDTPGTGSRSSAVYRRRRLLVGLVGLLVLIGAGLGVAGIAGAFGGDSDAEASAAAPTPTPTPTPTVTATTGYKPVQCLPGVLVISDSSTAAAHAVGAAVPFDLTLTNSGSVPCLIDGGSATLGVIVYSGSDRIWSSLDCPAEPAVRELLLDVGIQAELAATWEQVRSAPGCPGEQPAAKPGTYRAVVTIDGGGSATLGWERVFTIE